MVITFAPPASWVSWSAHLFADGRPVRRSDGSPLIATGATEADARAKLKALK